MEEILASIRRIIEESDTTRADAVPPPAVNSDRPSPSASSERAASDESLPPREGIAIKPPAPSAPPAFESPQRQPVSSVQPTVERTSYAEKLQRFAKAQDSTSGAVVDVSDNLETGVLETITEEVSAPLPEVPVAVELDQPEMPDQPAEFAEVQTTTDGDLASEQLEARVDDEVSFGLEQALEPILSEATERQVSSAFDDLSFAVHNEQRRSFDEIAQEIMRPLLQEWLDNNLPTLVERLVREEIERVARGGRR